jgi:hypothetical protein
VPRVRRNARWRENTPRTAEAVPVRDPTATSHPRPHSDFSVRKSYPQLHTGRVGDGLSLLGYESMDSKGD